MNVSMVTSNLGSMVSRATRCAIIFRHEAEDVTDLKLNVVTSA